MKFCLRMIFIIGWIYCSNANALDKNLYAKGESLAKICVMCHGKNGISNNPRVPHLAGQHEAYLLKQLKDFKSRRRFNSAMRQVTLDMETDDMKALAHYYSKLSR